MAKEFDELRPLLDAAEKSATTDLQRAMVAVSRKLLDSMEKHERDKKRMVKAIVENLKTQRQIRKIIGDASKKGRHK